MLFNGERDECSQPLAGSCLLPEAVCLPRPQGWGSAGWGRDAQKVSLKYKGEGGAEMGLLDSLHSALN